MTPVIGVLTAEHAGEALTVQRAAYVTEAQRYRAPDIPPLTETLAQLRADLDSPRVLAFGAWLGTRLVGAVRGHPAADRMEIARFVVAPDVQGGGIGSKLLAALHARSPQHIKVLWLVTGARSTENVRFYQRAGYQIVGTKLDAVGVELVLMEKRRGR